MSSQTTAIARITNGKDSKAVEAEPIPAMTSLAVPAALILAAESVSAKSSPTRSYLEGVFIHSKGDKGRIVGTDGARMFIASFALPEVAKVPPWLAEGVILSRDSLRSRVQLLGKLTDESDILVSYAKGNATAELNDLRNDTVFKVKVQSGTYPDYEKALGAHSFTDLDEEGNQANREWQPVGINSTYLKQCGDIAKTLEAGLTSGKRSKLGMVIRAFNGGDVSAPLVLDFSTWPGAILVLAPAIMTSRSASKETAALLAPALKSTLAALRAHATRWDQKAAVLTDEAAKSDAVARAAEFHKRVANILAIVPAGPAIAHKQPKPVETKPVETKQAEPVGAADVKAAPGDEAGGTARPATKRTRIKVPTQQHASSAAAAA